MFKGVLLSVYNDDVASGGLESAQMLWSKFFLCVCFVVWGFFFFNFFFNFF